MRKILKSGILLVVFGVLSSVANAQTQFENPDWQADLDFVTEQLPELHVDLFRINSRESFDEDVAALREKIGGMADVQAALAIQELIASFRDGHTSLVVSPGHLRYYPINMKWFDDGVYATVTAASFRKIAGAKLISINGMKTEEVLERLKGLLTHDNEYGFRNIVDNQLNTADYLQYIGVTETAASADFVFEEDGEEIPMTIRSRPVSEFDSIQWHMDGEWPLPFQKGHLSCWNDWIADQRTLYFKYNRCTDAEGFNRLVQGTRGFIEQNEVDKFVLDLRHNGGGNSEIFKPLFEYLKDHPEFDREGKLFVIIGRGTFSGGLWAAYDMKQTNAIFIGEPTGGKPNHFGEVKTVQLPNSGLTLNYSTKEWIFLEDEDPNFLEPDVRVEYSGSAYFAGEDPALNAVFDR